MDRMINKYAGVLLGSLILSCCGQKNTTKE